MSKLLVGQRHRQVHAPHPEITAQPNVRFAHPAPYQQRGVQVQRDEVAALDWLRDNGAGDTVVLASLAVGQYVPAMSDERAVLAHWAQTVDYFAKRDAVAAFYAPETSIADRRALLDKYNVRYVIVGPVELGPQPADYTPQTVAAGSGVEPDWAALGLETVFETETVKIYEVRR